MYLNESGYDVHGVDILEYWGKDANLYGAVALVVPDHVRAKLHTVSPSNNILPFDSGTFSLIFSDQTLEHVFAYRAVFAEQARVLKPGGIAIHRFPHGYALMERHTKVPLAPLNKFKTYLAIWALLGWRNHRQAGMDWRTALATNIGLFATTNYVPRRIILEAASGLGVEARFESFLDVGTGRAARLYRAAQKLGLGGIAGPVLAALQENRILVLQKPAS